MVSSRRIDSPIPDTAFQAVSEEFPILVWERLQSRRAFCSCVAVCGKRYRNRTGLSYHYTHSHLAHEQQRPGDSTATAATTRSPSTARSDRHKRKEPLQDHQDPHTGSLGSPRRIIRIPTLDHKDPPHWIIRIHHTGSLGSTTLDHQDPPHWITRIHYTGSLGSTTLDHQDSPHRITRIHHTGSLGFTTPDHWGSHASHMFTDAFPRPLLRQCNRLIVGKFTLHFS